MHASASDPSLTAHAHRMQSVRANFLSNSHTQTIENTFPKCYLSINYTVNVHPKGINIALYALRGLVSHTPKKLCKRDNTNNYKYKKQYKIEV
jgi:hypothetical protein